MEKTPDLKNKIMTLFIITTVISPVVEKIRYETLADMPISDDTRVELQSASKKCLDFAQRNDVDRSTQVLLKKLSEKMQSEDLSFINDLSEESTKYFGNQLKRLQNLFESCKVRALADDNA
jgi:hypothetical protein